jgi:hypothetical protein
VGVHILSHQVSSQGGIHSLWARNGKQLFYEWNDQVWAVDVRIDGGFATGKPRLLFERPGYLWGAQIRSYDLSKDGQRFLMVKLEQRKPTPVTEMILVQNWFEELKQKVPTGKWRNRAARRSSKSSPGPLFGAALALVPEAIRSGQDGPGHSPLNIHSGV